MSRCALTIAAVLLLPIALLADGPPWWEQEQTALVQKTEGENAAALANWQEGYVEAEGTGTADVSSAFNRAQAKLMAEEASRVRAYGVLAEAIFGFHITSEITVRQGIVADSVQQLRLEGFIKGARIVDARAGEAPDGSPLYWTKVGILMARRHPGLQAEAPPPFAPDAAPQVLSQAVMPTVTRVEQEKPLPRYAPPGYAPYSGLLLFGIAPLATADMGAGGPREEKDYTGLLLDARGTGAQPSISPKILTPAGEEVWGTMDVTPDYAIQYGIAGFAHTLEKGLTMPRVAADPLIIRSPEARGFTPQDPVKTYFVVSPEDADFILRMNQRTHFLQKCSVVFVCE